MSTGKFAGFPENNHDCISHSRGDEPSSISLHSYLVKKGKGIGKLLLQQMVLFGHRKNIKI